MAGQVGEGAVSQTRKVAASAGLAWSVLAAAARPRTWSRTVREAWVRQVIAAGVNALGITVFLAVALGVLVCVQFQVLVGQFNQSQVLPLIFVAAIVRELGPLLVNLILIARTGNAIATDLALMHVTGEVRVMEGQGIDPFEFVMLPRVLGLTFCAVCLTVIFVAGSLLGLYLCAEWIGAKAGSPGELIYGVLELLTPADIVNLFLKSTFPPLAAGCICCLEGIGAGSTLADVPRAAMRAVQRSIITLFAASAVISLLTYLR